MQHRGRGPLHKVPQKQTAAVAAAVPAGYADQDLAFYSRCMADTCLCLKELLKSPCCVVRMRPRGSDVLFLSNFLSSFRPHGRAMSQTQKSPEELRRLLETAALEDVTSWFNGLQGANGNAEKLQSTVAPNTALGDDKSPLENLLEVQDASESRNP